MRMVRPRWHIVARMAYSNLAGKLPHRIPVTASSRDEFHLAQAAHGHIGDLLPGRRHADIISAIWFGALMCRPESGVGLVVRTATWRSYRSSSHSSFPGSTPPLPVSSPGVALLPSGDRVTADTERRSHRCQRSRGRLAIHGLLTDPDDQSSVVSPPTPGWPDPGRTRMTIRTSSVPRQGRQCAGVVHLRSENVKMSRCTHSGFLAVARALRSRALGCWV